MALSPMTMPLSGHLTSLSILSMPTSRLRMCATIMSPAVSTLSPSLADTLYQEVKPSSWDNLYTSSSVTLLWSVRSLLLANNIVGIYKNIINEISFYETQNQQLAFAPSVVITLLSRSSFHFLTASKVVLRVRSKTTKAAAASLKKICNYSVTARRYRVQVPIIYSSHVPEPLLASNVPQLETDYRVFTVVYYLNKQNGIVLLSSFQSQ